MGNTDLLRELAGEDRSSIEKQQRIKKAKKDFEFFCSYYLSDYFFEAPAEYQKVLYEVANNRSLTEDIAGKLKKYVREKYQNMLKPTKKLAGAMFIEPREHGKTVRWSFAYVLWCALTGRAKYILLIGASNISACENLENIKIEIEENEKILEDFGAQEGNTWTSQRLELKCNVCIQAKGSGGAMRGTRYRQYRPDLIVIDDVLKDDAVNSPTQRDKIYKWLKRVVFGLGKDAFIIWVNTVFHNDDPISRLCREVKTGDLVNWIAVRLSCILEDGSPLWPEYWDIQALNDKKRSVGVAAFSTEYMNEPLSDEERIIKQEWIDTYRYSDLPDKNRLQMYMGVDPATGAHDGTAMVPIARDKETGTIYVLPGFNETCTEDRTVKEVTLLHKFHNFIGIGWEKVVFSAIYGQYIQKLAAEKGTYLPIMEITVGNASKEMRIRSYSMMIQTGIIRFPVRGCEAMEQQLTEFPLGAFDDYCDGLYLAIKTAEKGGNSYVAMQTVKNFVKTTANSIINKARRR